MRLVSAPGVELLRLLPPGYDIALDLGGDQPVRLHEDLWRDPTGNVGR